MTKTSTAQAVISLDTKASLQAIDVTDDINAHLSNMAISGWALLNVPHTTAALILTENDPDLLRDIEKTADRLLAPLQPFAHHKNNNPNAAAHLFSAILGTQVFVERTGTGIRLGTYQRLIFVELDGPKQRHIQVTGLTGRTA